MLNLPKASVYAESTAAQLLRPRVDLLTKDGGLDYKELNNRILADNVTEDIKNDHNPIYGGINGIICAVERQNSFTINDETNQIDIQDIHPNVRSILIKTTDDSNIISSADGFVGDPVVIKINEVLSSDTIFVVDHNGLKVNGSLQLDKTKLIIDENIKNPFMIDASDQNDILLTINPNAKNTIPLIFVPEDKNKSTLRFYVKIVIIDQREEAVIPEIKNGTYLSVAALNSTNSTSFKYLNGTIKVSNAATVVGGLVNSKTKEDLTSVNCAIEIGTAFPNNPTSYLGQGNTALEKLENTLFATATFTQSTIRPLVVVLPIIYATDNRSERGSLSSLSVEQVSNLEINYNNSGFTFRGEAANINLGDVDGSVLSMSAKNASNEDVDLSVVSCSVKASLNKDQSASKATVIIHVENDITNNLSYEIDVTDNRPFRQKESWSATHNFSVTINNSTFNAGHKGQAWKGNSLSITGTLTSIENQFGREISGTDVLLQSFSFINLNSNSIVISDKGDLSIEEDSGENGSTLGKCTLFVVIDDLNEIEIPINVSVTDNRT